MDPIELGQTLGRIEAKLDAHTAQDTVNFEELGAKMDALDWRPAARRAIKWAVGVALTIGGGVPAYKAVAEALRALVSQ